ncbi:MAG: glycine cleavage system aminomethyltransferase GcvT [Planctomycetota bacterium]
MKATPLASVHEALGARMIDFGGWNMPVQYKGILEEVETVRNRAGLFDLCHMGRFWIEGTGAEAGLQATLTNDVTTMKEGQIRYSLLCDAQGKILDDILVYKANRERFFMVVNASNTEKDFTWIQKSLGGQDATVRDETESLAMIALQGKGSAATLQPHLEGDLGDLKYYRFFATKGFGFELLVSRTGYTGEDGFELYYPVAEAEAVWNALMESGREHGLEPIGLGARDTLRLEAGMPLYGHEISADHDPIEAGLGWAVKLDKDFIGRDALQKVKEAGPSRRLCGFVSDGQRIPRQGHAILEGDEVVGEVCSGTLSPTLDRRIATGYVPTRLAETGTKLALQIRKDRQPLEVVPLPFYKRSS